MEEYYPHILLVGSGEEYGMQRSGNITVPEDTPLHPSNMYAVTKACQNMIGSVYARAYGMGIVMVRAFNHIGVGQSPQFVAADFALVLFKVVPETLWEGLTRLLPSLNGSGYIFNILRGAFTGIIKIAILVGYMAAVSLMKDIKRTFMYHGAEHKTIFCYEQGLELTVENVRKQRRFHPRCGTSFLILMLLVSIFVSIFIPAKFVDNGVLNVVIRTGIGLLTLPVIMGIGYELIKFAGRHNNLFTRVISAPGVWLQHITTKEPTDDMIECAIAAMKEVIPNDDSDAW